ncbi:hypothetical protein DCCM_0896 [Desulfocucumis palustris]|uniref:Uncharacterized protein n=1 Tax=Desulfocucumis palustris TaxID=1898651 RepID=A0A2L2X9I4_9FIRM|nr:hypothetical protein [Desulfocucumis palustris]GBF32700.1 hypothetical protein DCCM_0896 [Desulfocucumis palustris]
MTILGLQYKGREDVTDSVGLLISILVRYPEVATIKYDPGEHVLKFTFIAAGVVETEKLDSIKDNLINSIEVFNILEGKEVRVTKINCQTCHNLTMVEVQRDVDTLVQEEIALIVELIHQLMENDLVMEGNDALFEEDLIIQEEIIEHMLESVKGTAGDKDLFAFREEGRVLVFNK